VVPTTVTNLNDAGDGSLRGAITATPAGGVVDFQNGLNGTITLTTGVLTIGKNLSIAGPGANVITVSGNNASEVFDIGQGFVVTISALTIANGSSNTRAGAVDNSGTLTLSNCTIRDSNAGTTGGGVYNNGGTMTVDRCTLQNNRAGTSGGAITNSFGTLTITNSTITNNRATWDGAGISNWGTLTITDTTFSDNQANRNGGGISNNDTLTLSRTTLSRNVSLGNGGGIYNNGTQAGNTNITISGNAANQGAGIYNVTGSTDNLRSATITDNRVTGKSLGQGGGMFDEPGATVTMIDTLIAGNFADAVSDDVSGFVFSQGHNLIGDGSGGNGFVGSDQVGSPSNPINPLLGPLQDNGGPTQTHALLPGSPAIDTGDNNGAPDTDQRGFTRIVNGIIDIGSYEFGAVSGNTGGDIGWFDGVNVRAGKTVFPDFFSASPTSLGPARASWLGGPTSAGIDPVGPTTGTEGQETAWSQLVLQGRPPAIGEAWLSDGVSICLA
jgi:predicted outer membrane repeat protein